MITGISAEVQFKSSLIILKNRLGQAILKLEIKYRSS